MTFKEPSHAEISILAYSLWEEGGRVDGYDVDDWLRAEQNLRIWSSIAGTKKWNPRTLPPLREYWPTKRST